MKTEKPLSQGPLGGVLGILGLVLVFVLIVGVVVTICMVYRRGQKPSTETDNDLTDIPSAHTAIPLQQKTKNNDLKGGLASATIQVVRLEKEDEVQKLPLHSSYNDVVPSESTTFTNKTSCGHKDCDVQYAELDTAALASSSRSSVKTCGDLVEYATIQPSSH